MRRALSVLLAVSLAMAQLPVAAMADEVVPAASVDNSATPGSQSSDAGTPDGADAGSGGASVSDGSGGSTSTAPSASVAATSPATSSTGAPAPTGAGEPGSDADDGSDATERIEVAAKVIGIDAGGAAEVWAEDAACDMPAGSTAADLTVEVLRSAGLTADYSDGEYGFYLSSITAPDGRVLGWDKETGRYWRLFVDGEPSEVGAGSVELAAGTEISWRYMSDSEGAPGDGDGDAVDPDVPRPDIGAEWPGFAGGASGSAVEGAATPTGSAEAAWTLDYKFGAAWATASDPVIAGGDVYIVASGRLMRVDGDTGSILKTAVVEGTGYFCRPVFADGLIVVPSDSGSLAAYTADELVCVWRTPALEKPVVGGVEREYQALSSLTVADGRIVAAFTVEGSAGALVCVDADDGSVVWTRVSQASGEGYYWAGAAASGDDLVIGGDAGEARLVDGATGEILSAVDLGASIRSTVVAAGERDGLPAFLAVTSDGVLHLVVRDGDALSEAGSVSFAARSTSTPAVLDGLAFVCGADASGAGCIAVVDLATMRVVDSASTDGGEAKSAPLVSRTAHGVHAYFTCNSEPGGVYAYRLGSGSAQLLFAPEGDLANFCTASIAVDAEGNLYYVNDSGTLFKLRAAKGQTGSGGGQEGGGTGTDETQDGGDESDRGAATHETTGAGSRDAAASASPSAPARRVKAASAPAAEDAVFASATTDDGAAATAAALSARGIPAESAAPANIWAVIGCATGVAGLIAVAVYLATSGRNRYGA